MFTFSPSQSGLGTFQVFRSHMGLAAATLQSDSMDKQRLLILVLGESVLFSIMCVTGRRSLCHIKQNRFMGNDGRRLQL